MGGCHTLRCPYHFRGRHRSGHLKADVLVSLALVASLCIGEIFAAGEVAFIMQLGARLEELTVAKARAGIERLVHLTPRTARVLVITNSAFLLKWRKKA